MTELFLIEHGFSKKFIVKKTDKGVFVARIHERIFLEFDTNDNFFTLCRNSENHKLQHRIIIPNKCKNHVQFEATYFILTGNKL